MKLSARQTSLSVCVDASALCDSRHRTTEGPWEEKGSGSGEVVVSREMSAGFSKRMGGETEEEMRGSSSLKSPNISARRGSPEARPPNAWQNCMFSLMTVERVCKGFLQVWLYKRGSLKMTRKLDLLSRVEKQVIIIYIHRLSKIEYQESWALPCLVVVFTSALIIRIKQELDPFFSYSLFVFIRLLSSLSRLLFVPIFVFILSNSFARFFSCIFFLYLLDFDIVFDVKK